MQLAARPASTQRRSASGREPPASQQPPAPPRTQHSNFSLLYKKNLQVIELKTLNRMRITFLQEGMRQQTRLLEQEAERLCKGNFVPALMSTAVPNAERLAHRGLSWPFFCSVSSCATKKNNPLRNARRSEKPRVEKKRGRSKNEF